MNKKCDMCGGNIIIQPGATFGICDSCGAKTDLGLTWQEKEQLRQRAKSQEMELLNIQTEKEKLIDQINDLGKFNTVKKCNIAQLAVSIFSVVLAFAGTEIPKIGDAMMGVSIIGMIVTMVLLAKYSQIWKGKKGRIAGIILLQLFTLCIFGCVVGFVDLFKILGEKKEASKIEVKLQKQLEHLSKQEEIIRNNSDFQL